MRRGTRHEALEPIRQGVAERFGGVAQDVGRSLAVRHDHGSQYMSHDFQKEIAWLGATSSPAFVRAPEGNGCAERFIRTLKENLTWVRTFRTVEEAPPRPDRLQAQLQRNLADRAARTSFAGPIPARWIRCPRPPNRNRISRSRGRYTCR
jgi:transposase InsO family protein